MTNWPEKNVRFKRDTCNGNRWNRGDFVIWDGYEDGDIAALVGVSEATAKRDWQKARPLFIDILKEWPRDAR